MAVWMSSAAATRGMIGRSRARRTALMAYASEGSSIASKDAVVGLADGEHLVLAQEGVREIADGSGVLEPLVVLDHRHTRESPQIARTERVRLHG